MDEPLRNLWLSALDQEFGLQVRTNVNIDSFVADLYRTRVEMEDPRLECFSIVKLKTGDVFIFRREMTLEELEKANAPSLP